ncbi:MAG: hypothetical protein AB7Y46_08460 [Armatimonadota bacterium]
MRGSAVRWIAIGVGAVLVIAAAAQQASQTRTGRLTYGQLEWNFAKNTIVVTGSPATLVVEGGGHKAELRAARMDINADARLEQIHGATAAGPVNLDLLTAPDETGRRRRITAACTQRATYSQAEDTVTMTGNVVADIITLPESEAEAAHLESEAVTVNLRTSTLTARPGSFEVTTEMDVPEGQ